VLTLSGESIKTLIDRTVRRAFAEGLNDAGLDTPVLVSLWCAGFMEGAKAPDGRSPDEANQAVADELERLGVDGIVTCEFPSVIGVSNDAAAAGVLVTKLVALGKSGIPIVGFEIKRNVVAVRSKRPLTFEEHKTIGDACREYSVAVLGVPTRLAEHWTEEERRETDRRSIEEATRLTTRLGSYGYRSTMDPDGKG
jgi:hypothetical protein